MEQVWDSVPFWTREEGRIAINGALYWWNLYTQTFRKPASLTTVASQHIYSVPAALTFATRVKYLSNAPLRKTSRIELGRFRPSWRSEVAATGSLPSTPVMWAPLGTTRLILWPAPAASGKSVTVEGVCVTPTLIAESEYLNLVGAEVRSILSEAIHLAAFKLGGQRFAGTVTLHRQFLTAALEKNDRLGAEIRFKQLAGIDTARHSQQIRQYPRAGDKLNRLVGGNR